MLRRGNGRGGRGRGKAKRGKRACISSDEETEQQPETIADLEPEPTGVENVPPPQQQPQQIDIEADISQLEAPTFTTISRGPPEPMVRLKWNHLHLLIGEKVLNPMIHCCDTCLLPILHYGRMIPCKHVFCLMCAKREPIKECPRCKDKVCRVEQSGLGSVFMCTHGGSRYNNKGCRRTYLSQRDLEAHIRHRHISVAPNRPAGPESTTEKSSVAGNLDKGTPLITRKAPIGSTTPSGTPSASFRSGGGGSQSTNTPTLSSVRTNLMNMQENISEESQFSRHTSRNNNWNSNSNYR